MSNNGVRDKVCRVKLVAVADLAVNFKGTGNKFKICKGIFEREVKACDVLVVGNVKLDIESHGLSGFGAGRGEPCARSVFNFFINGRSVFGFERYRIGSRKSHVVAAGKNFNFVVFCLNENGGGLVKVAVCFCGLRKKQVIARLKHRNGGFAGRHGLRVVGGGELALRVGSGAVSKILIKILRCEV